MGALTSASVSPPVRERGSSSTYPHIPSFMKIWHISSQNYCQVFGVFLLLFGRSSPYWLWSSICTQQPQLTDCLCLDLQFRWFSFACLLDLHISERSMPESPIIIADQFFPSGLVSFFLRGSEAELFVRCLYVHDAYIFLFYFKQNIISFFVLYDFFLV